MSIYRGPSATGESTDSTAALILLATTAANDSQEAAKAAKASEMVVANIRDAAIVTISELRDTSLASMDARNVYADAAGAVVTEAVVNITNLYSDIEALVSVFEAATSTELVFKTFIPPPL